MRLEDGVPPWWEPGDLPLPAWARSITPTREGAAFYAEAGKIELRRGSAQLGARLPIFATKRAAGCQGRWILAGPLAWICSDVADFSADEPGASPLGTRPGDSPEGRAPTLRLGAQPVLPVEPLAAGDDGLPFRYYFAGRDGAFGFTDLERALDDSPDQELEQGFAVAAVEERSAHGERWVRTRKGRWIAARELVAAPPMLFHGERVDGEPALGWIVADKASVFASDKADKATGARMRFEKFTAYEERVSKTNTMVRISADGEPPAWVRARDVARVRRAEPPAEALEDGPDARWIDVDLAAQVLVAYEGKRPVFATLVSTGRGPAGSDSATPPGVHRIWVKLFATKMDNLDKEDVSRHYAIEDVPWVQFFDKAVALHGAFWHHDFGRVHSHGCVNLAPLDARWLFAFTAPHLPSGWTAVLPMKVERGTVVRVH